VDKRIQAAKIGPLALFVLAISSVQSAVQAQLWLDHSIVAVRVIEALRFYDTAHNGILPKTLD
jgi:hypothetical protein